MAPPGWKFLKREQFREKGRSQFYLENFTETGWWGRQNKPESEKEP